MKTKTAIYLGCILFSCSIACDKPIPSEPVHGIKKNYASFVPARIAILPCRLWPQAAIFEPEQLTNITGEPLLQLCSKVDEFVLKGFSDQPYMNGYTPKAIVAMLEQAGKKDFLKDIDTLWLARNVDCIDCAAAPNHYQENIALQSNWRAWINELARNCRYVDALLLPLVVLLQEERQDNRGLLESHRKAQVVLLLIDTNSGALIWSGGRSSDISNKKVREQRNHYPAMPPWETLQENLLIEQIWQKFPGRIFY